MRAFPVGGEAEEMQGCVPAGMGPEEVQMGITWIIEIWAFFCLGAVFLSESCDAGADECWLF